MSRHPKYSDHGVAIELAWRSYSVLVGDTLREHDAFTALLGTYNACTALSHCPDGVLRTQ